jgi:hypothetical protein
VCQPTLDCTSYLSRFPRSKYACYCLAWLSLRRYTEAAIIIEYP